MLADALSDRNVDGRQTFNSLSVSKANDVVANLSVSPALAVRSDKTAEVRPMFPYKGYFVAIFPHETEV